VTLSSILTASELEKPLPATVALILQKNTANNNRDAGGWKETTPCNEITKETTRLLKL